MQFCQYHHILTTYNTGVLTMNTIMVAKTVVRTTADISFVSIAMKVVKQNHLGLVTSRKYACRYCVLPE